MKLLRPQMRVLLDHLGVPFYQQGSTVTENMEQLATFERAKPEEYQAAYDLVIHHKLPEGDVTTEQLNAKKLGELVSEHFQVQETQAISSLKRDANKYYQSKLDMLAEDANQIMKDEAKKFRKVKVESPGKKPIVIDGILPAEFDEVVQLGAERINTMLVGPSGCGKSFMAEKVAEALGLEFSAQSCSEGMSESVFTGWLLPIEDGGRFVYVESEFVKRYENGGVFLLDEIDASDPNVLVFINQAIAGDKFFLPQRYDNPIVKRHKDFVMLAAGNTFGGGGDSMFVGRNQLDEATRDRFRMGMIHMDYDSAVEDSVCDSTILGWALAVRVAIRSHKLRRTMSTRFMKDSTTMMRNQNWDLQKIKDTYFCDWSDSEKKMMEGLA